MYLTHFKLQQYPFKLTPNTEFFCDLPTHQSALNVLLLGLNSGEGFIKIIGEVGSGKTLLCRKLLNSLDEKFISAYIPNPDLEPMELRKTFAHELGIKVTDRMGQNKLRQLLLEKLLAIKAENRRVVLIVDEAQALYDESLEALRLLTNYETETDNLLQIVLFGQPELNARLAQHRFRQFNQRITFSYLLGPLNKKELKDYLAHRLSTAGSDCAVFSKKACRMLYKASGGTPRIINIIGHKSLLAAYGLGHRRVKYKAMRQAIKDSHEIVPRRVRIL